MSFSSSASRGFAALSVMLCYTWSSLQRMQPAAPLAEHGGALTGATDADMVGKFRLDYVASHYERCHCLRGHHDHDRFWSPGSVRGRHEGAHAEPFSRGTDHRSDTRNRRALAGRGGILAGACL